MDDQVDEQEMMCARKLENRCVCTFENAQAKFEAVQYRGEESLFATPRLLITAKP